MVSIFVFNQKNCKRKKKKIPEMEIQIMIQR